MSEEIDDRSPGENAKVKTGWVPVGRDLSDVPIREFQSLISKLNDTRWYRGASVLGRVVIEDAAAELRCSSCEAKASSRRSRISGRSLEET